MKKEKHFVDIFKDIYVHYSVKEGKFYLYLYYDCIIDGEKQNAYTMLPITQELYEKLLKVI